MQLDEPGDLPAGAEYWQRRRSGVRVYFCCCPIPLLLLLSPLALLLGLLWRGIRRRLSGYVAAGQG